MHSWSLEASLQHMQQEGAGVELSLLNCGESGEQLLAQFEGTAQSAQAPVRVAWTCAPMAWARKSCVTAACTACA